MGKGGHYKNNIYFDVKKYRDYVLAFLDTLITKTIL